MLLPTLVIIENTVIECRPLVTVDFCTFDGIIAVNKQSINGQWQPSAEFTTFIYVRIFCNRYNKWPLPVKNLQASTTSLHNSLCCPTNDTLYTISTVWRFHFCVTRRYFMLNQYKRPYDHNFVPRAFAAPFWVYTSPIFLDGEVCLLRLLWL